MNTNPRGHSTADLALMDQAVSTFRHAALAYAKGARESAEEYGTAQATADLGALLMHEYAADYIEDPRVHNLAALAAAALMLLGKTDAGLQTYGGTE